MKIDAVRDEGGTVLRLGGRLDREGAEHLSNTLEDLLRDGVRSLTIDLKTVTHDPARVDKLLPPYRATVLRVPNQPVEPAVRKAIVDDDVLPFNPPELAQPLSELLVETGRGRPTP